MSTACNKLSTNKTAKRYQLAAIRSRWVSIGHTGLRVHLSSLIFTEGNEGEWVLSDRTKSTRAATDF